MSETVTLKPSGTRNQGIDLLRNLSMFMVVMLHVLGLFRLMRIKQLLVKLENKLFPKNGGSQ